MTKEDVQAMVDAAVTKAMEKPTNSTEQVIKEDKPAEITEETIKKMVSDAIAEANIQKSEPEKPLTIDAVQAIVTKAVDEAMAPVLKAAGIPSNLNNDGEHIKKSEGHYMDNIFGC